MATTADEGSTLKDLIEDADSKVALEEKNRQLRDEIENEVKESQEVYSLKIPIIDLANFYADSDPNDFYAKAVELQQEFVSFRKVRGDGNCFYRAISYAVHEMCITDAQFALRYRTKLEAWRRKLIDELGYPDMTTDDFFDFSVEFLDNTSASAASSSTDWSEELFKQLSDEQTSNYLVCALRLIASGYLRDNASELAGFVEDGLGIDDYCRQKVEPMFQDVDHLQIAALIKALDISVRIQYMDRSKAPAGGWHHDFCTDESAGEMAKITLLYRPGHYDILYR